MWNVAPVIFEEEDEEALKADFIRLCALYPNQGIFEIAAHVFRFQRDPEMRAQQAAMIWSKDIDIQERIRLARVNGGAEASPIPSKEERLRQLQELFEASTTSVKDKVAVARLISEIQGEIVKAVDKNVTDNRRQPPRQIIFAQQPDE